MQAATLLPQWWQAFEDDIKNDDWQPVADFYHPEATY